MNHTPEQELEQEPSATSGKALSGVRTSREQLAWGLVGWMNFIAMAIIGLIVAHVSGYTLTNMAAWIVGAVALTIFVVVGTLWLMIHLD